MPASIPNPINNTKNFVAVKGAVRYDQVPILASTAFEEGTALAPNGSGYYTVATAISTGIVFAGEAVASTDADYASTTKTKSVWFPAERDVEVKFTVGAGTFTTADIGNTCVLHTGAKTLAVDTAGIGQFRITKYINSTTGRANVVNFPQ